MMLQLCISTVNKKMYTVADGCVYHVHLQENMMRPSTFSHYFLQINDDILSNETKDSNQLQQHDWKKADELCLDCGYNHNECLRKPQTATWSSWIHT